VVKITNGKTSANTLGKEFRLKKKDKETNGKTILTKFMTKKLLPRVTFFALEVMSILVYKNCLCYPKKFRAIIDKNFISVHDTSFFLNITCTIRNVHQNKNGE